MRTSHNRLILIFAFGSLIALIVIAGYTSIRGAMTIYHESLQIRRTYSERERELAAIDSGMHRGAVLVRDYLLDPSHLTAESYRDSMRETRQGIVKALDHLDLLSAPEDLEQRKKLRAEIDAYWESFDPLFDWTPVQKMALSTFFLREHVLPRRDAVRSMSQAIQDLNQANLRRQESSIEQRQMDFRKELKTTFVLTATLALLIAVVTVFYLARLESRADEGRRQVEKAESEMRRLSAQVVQAQEAERKELSRELHDEVGQMLTGLRLELAGLSRLANGDTARFAEKLAEARAMAERTLQSVRQLAMGLRPSMLDDLGLGPAIEWQGREFSRRTGVPVNVEISGNLEGLPEAHRTCAYRIVQEALTNCARHARAKQIRVMLLGGKEVLAVTVHDDGVGFAPEGLRDRGLGLIGIEERVRELGGEISLRSAPGRGTVLSVEIPLVSKEVS